MTAGPPARDHLTDTRKTTPSLIGKVMLTPAADPGVTMAGSHGQTCRLGRSWGAKSKAMGPWTMC